MSKKILKALKKEYGDERGAQMYLDIIEKGEEQEKPPVEDDKKPLPEDKPETPKPDDGKTDTDIKDKPEPNVIINVNEATKPVSQSDADVVNDFFNKGGF